MKYLGFFILTYFVLSVNSYIDDEYDYVHFIPETRYVDFLQMNLNFTTKFYKQLTKIETNDGKNIVFSPFSIQSAGASLYAGAKVDSETADEIEDGLKFVSHDNRVLGDIYRKFVNIMRTSSMYKIGTKMYISRNYSVSPKFQDVVSKYYLTEIEQIDFNDDTIEITNLVNNWITDRTDGKIVNFVKNYDIKKLAKIFLLNVIHFNGEWLKKFDKDKTKKDNFITEPNETIQVDMMHGYFNFRSAEHKDLNVSLAELTFRNTNMTMIIVVPSSPEIPLKQIEDKLRHLLFEDGIFNKTGYNESRHIIMPKFSIEIELDLEQFFKNLGILDIFTSEANFSALLNNATNSNIYVSKILHKTVFNINEDGIASFAQNEYHTRGEHEQEPFIVNQSFLYFIRGIHGEIYFMGRFTGK